MLRGRTDELPADLALRVAIVCGHTTDDRADGRMSAGTRPRRRHAQRVGSGSTSTGSTRTHGLLLLAGFPDRLAARRRPGSSRCAPAPGRGSPTTTRWRRAPVPRRCRPRRQAIALADPSRRSGRGVRDRRRPRRRRRGLPPRVGRRSRRPRGARRAAARRAPAGEEVRPPEPGAATRGALVARVRAPSSPRSTGRPRRAGARPCRPAAGDARRRVARRSDGELLRTLDEWLAPHLRDGTSGRDLSGLDLAKILRHQLPGRSPGDSTKFPPPSWTLPDPPDRAERSTPTDRRVSAGTGRVRHPGAPDHGRGRVPIPRPALPRQPADPGDGRSARLLGPPGPRTQGARRPLPQAPWPNDPANEPPGRQRPR